VRGPYPIVGVIGTELLHHVRQGAGQYDAGAYRGDTVGEAMRVSISGVS
jgi:hypothetical protein